MTMTIEPSDCLRTGIVSLHLPAPWPPCRRRCLPLGHFTSGHKVTDRLPGAFLESIPVLSPGWDAAKVTSNSPVPLHALLRDRATKVSQSPQCSREGHLAEMLFLPPQQQASLPGPQIFPTSSTPHLTLLVDQLPSRCIRDGSHFPFGQRT